MYPPIKSCKMYFLDNGFTRLNILCSTPLLDKLEVLIVNGNIHLMFAYNQISSIFGEKKGIPDNFISLI